MTRQAKIHEKVVIAPDYEALSELAATQLAELLTTKPDCNLGLPTGNSPLGCYKLLSKWSQRNGLSWKDAKCFALDDYLDAEEAYTFSHFLQTNLYDQTDLPSQSKFNPRFSEDYDQLIACQGGLDCILLGIGTNGHIAFNEPPTPRASWTHCVWLSESTQKSNRKYFANALSVPSRAVTMGIATILSSRKIVLIASGENKRDILAQAMTSEANADLPASFLTMHPNLLVITDFDC